MYLALAALTCVAASADPIVGSLYNSSCSAYGAPTVVGNASCVSDPTGKAFNTNGLSFGYSGAKAQSNVVANGYNDIHATQQLVLDLGYANSTDPTHIISGLPSSGSTSAQFVEYLTTAGPVRQGYVLLNLTNHNNGPEDNGSGGGSFNLSLLQGNPFLSSGIGCGTAISDTCQGALGTLNHFDQLGGFQVTLGQAFYATYTGFYSGAADGFNGNGTGLVDLDFQFQFTELDGTPVAVMSAAPEPGTLGLLGISFSAAFALLRKKR